MKSVTWTQVAQYIILILSYLVPVVYLSFTLFTLPIPELTYGKLLQQNNATELRLTADPKEKETRALWKKDADELTEKLKDPGLSEADRIEFAVQRAPALAQARPLAPSETSKFGNTLTVPTGYGMWNFLALTFCLMVGTAGLPHILTRYYTTPSVKQARTSVAWSLFFIFLLYFTAPAYAAFARFTIYAKLVGTKIAELPRWVTLWQPAGLFEVVDKNKDGVVQWADFVVKSTYFVVLADRRAGRVGVQPCRRLVLPGARHGHLVEAREQDRRRGRHDRRARRHHVLHDRQPVLWRAVVGHADHRVGHLRPAGGLPRDLDRVAADGAAAAAGAGSRRQ